MLDIDGAHLDYPQIKQPTADAVAAILPVNFGDLLALAVRLLTEIIIAVSCKV